MWSKDFGAAISEHITKRTTHVIAARNRRTAKVRQALRYQKIKIVGVDWLHDCFVQWRQVDETPYAIHTEPDQQQQQQQQMSPQELVDGSILEDVEDVNLSSEDDIDAPTPVGGTDNANTNGNGSGNNNSIEEDLEALEPKSPMVERSMIGGTDQDWRNMHDEMEEWLAESGISADSDDDDDDDSDGNANDKHGEIDNGNDKNSSSGSVSGDEDRESDSSRSRGRKRKRKHRAFGTASADATDGEESDAGKGVGGAADGHARSNDGGAKDSNHDVNSSNNDGGNDLSRLQKRKRRALQRVSSLNKVTSAENQALPPSSSALLTTATPKNLPSHVDPTRSLARREGEGVDSSKGPSNHHPHPQSQDGYDKSYSASDRDMGNDDEASLGNANAKHKTGVLEGKPNATNETEKEGDAKHLKEKQNLKEKEKEKEEEEDADLEAEMEAELSREDL